MKQADFSEEKLRHPIFQTLRNIADKSTYEIYVVGGFVRDLFLNRPTKDVDIVTVGSGLDLAHAFAQELGIENVVVYENFGVAMVHSEWGDVEFVGARKESYRQSSRKPIVENGSLHDDLLRRDFTINAIAIGLSRENDGQIIDPFNGLSDISDKIIRTPANPDITFSEDPLRMMRAIRFAATLRYTIAENTYKAIIKNKERIQIVSMERVSEELNKMLMASEPSIGFKLLFKTGLLELIFPEMFKLYGVDVINGIGHKDNFYHTLKVLDNVSKLSDNLWLRWSAVLHDIAKPATKKFEKGAGWTFHGHEDKGAKMTPKIFYKLRLPQNEKMRYVQKLVKLHLRPIALVDSEVTDSAIRRLVVDAGENLEDLLKLCRADITTRDSNKLEKYLANFDYVEKRVGEVAERDKLRNWQPPITGEIIMNTFKINAGPLVGQIKNEIREAILEGIIPNEYAAAEAYMHQIANKFLNI